jgi:hypothetical protein
LQIGNDVPEVIHPCTPSQPWAQDVAVANLHQQLEARSGTLEKDTNHPLTGIAEAIAHRRVAQCPELALILLQVPTGQADVMEGGSLREDAANGVYRSLAIARPASWPAAPAFAP